MDHRPGRLDQRPARRHRPALGDRSRTGGLLAALAHPVIAQARTKTDKLDARTLAVLLWKRELESVWVPDERARVLRRRLARRKQLVHARSN